MVVFPLGERCNVRIKNIPYKPLSERMLEEPFWLGLIAVTAVLSVIGVCYLFKKHLPDKFDKIVQHGTTMMRKKSSENQLGKGQMSVTAKMERKVQVSQPVQHPSSFVSADAVVESGGAASGVGGCGGTAGGGHRAVSIAAASMMLSNHHHSSYFSDDGSLTTANPSGLNVLDSNSPGAMAKSLFGKLAIRKPSILSIASNLSSPGGGGDAAGGSRRDFGGSLEDIHRKSEHCRLSK